MVTHSSQTAIYQSLDCDFDHHLVIRSTIHNQRRGGGRESGRESESRVSTPGRSVQLGVCGLDCGDE
jgi:hypothetical protein